MPKKKPKKGKPQVNKNLAGYEITINEFGQIKTSLPIDEINKFLNDNVDDKKLRDRDDLYSFEGKEEEERQKALKKANINRPIRVLVAKVGLDGHDRGAKIIAASLRDAGMEVIYTGLRQTPEMVVNTALQEDVDVIGVSVLSGAHNTIFPKIIAEMKAKELTDVLLTGGGIIPEEDHAALLKIGVEGLFPPGTPTSEIIGFITDWVIQNREF